jgi:WD40 repeat protein
MDSTDPHRSDTFHRQSAIARLIDDAREARSGGRLVKDEDIIGANPELMPELQQALDKLRRVQEARAAADKPPLEHPMSDSNLAQVKRILREALALRAGERQSFIAAQCDGNPDFLADVKAMLAALEAATAEQFMAQPPADPSPALLETLSASISEGSGSRIGNYKLLQLIGEGGFGSVFMAEQRQPVHRKVALKIIKLGMDTRQVIARFEAERQALAIMDHPNIARVLDAGATEGGRPYFVMELVKGDPITKYCDDNHLSISERLELFIQVCHAVQHAHQKGIIHRDLKPNNILVSTQDGRPFAKVIDFGIAKATASRLTEKTLFTEHRALVGTPEYMSPEQASGSLDIDTRTDVYSLGVLLYELLTGSTPFDAQSLRRVAYEEIERVIRETDPPKPSTRISASIQTIQSVAAHRRTEPKKLGTIVRGELDWIVMKALEKDRARRYESASGLADDVGRYNSGGAVVAAPPSAVYRVRKFARRYRTAIATSGAVAAVLVGGIIASWIEAARAHRAEQKVGGQLVVVENAEKVAQLQTAEAKRRLKEATEANQRAEMANRTVKRLASDHFVELGVKEWENKEFAYAALWFIQALKLDAGDPEREKLQRLRIGGSFANCSRPIDMPVKESLSATAPAPRELWWNDKEFGVRDVATHKAISPAIPKGELGWFEFGPDGNVIIAWGADTARLWDAGTGAPLTPAITKKKGNSPFFSPNRRSIALLTAGSVQVLDAVSGKIASSIPDDKAADAQFSPDGTALLIRSAEYERLWDARSGKPITPEVRALPSAFHGEFSPDGSIFMTQSDDGAVLSLWNVQSGQFVANLADMSGIKVFSKDGKSLLRYGSLIDVHDTRTGNLRFPAITPQKIVKAASFSADGTRILAILQKGYAQVYDANTGKPESPVQLTKYLEMGGMDLSSNGNFILTADDSMRVWDAATGQLVASPIRMPRYGSRSPAAFSADSNQIIIRGDGDDDYGGTWVRVHERALKWPYKKDSAEFWDPWTHEPTWNFNSDAYPKCIAFCNNGKYLVANIGGCVRLLDPLTCSPVAPPFFCTDDYHDFGGMAMALSPDGTRLAIGGDTTVHVWNTTTAGQACLPVKCEIGSHAIALAFSPDDTLLAALSVSASAPWNAKDVRLQVWDVRNGNIIFATSASHYENRIAFSPDGSSVLAWGHFGAIGWDIHSGKALSGTHDQSANLKSSRYTFGNGLSFDLSFETINDARTGQTRMVDHSLDCRHQDIGFWALSPDAHRVLQVESRDQGSATNSASILDATTGAVLVRSIDRDGAVTRAHFSQDGKLIVTVNADQTVRVVDAVTGIPVVPPLDFEDTVLDAGFSPDGGLLASVCEDGELRVWPLTSADMPVDVAERLAEFLACARIDEMGRRVSQNPFLGQGASQTVEQWFERRQFLRKQIPKFFQLVEAQPENTVSPEYQAAIAAQVLAAKTPEEKSALARRLMWYSHEETDAGFAAHPALLAETALSLDGSLLGAKDDLACAYLLLGRPNDALQIYSENRGRRFVYWEGRPNEPDQVFGATGIDTIKILRDSGKDDPTFAKIEAIIAPTTQPAATQPATTQPAATEPATRPAAEAGK